MVFYQSRITLEQNERVAHTHPPGRGQPRFTCRSQTPNLLLLLLMPDGTIQLVLALVLVLMLALVLVVLVLVLPPPPPPPTQVSRCPPAHQPTPAPSHVL